jgi:hypothetical protein
MTTSFGEAKRPPGLSNSKTDLTQTQNIFKSTQATTLKPIAHLQDSEPKPRALALGRAKISPVPISKPLNPIQPVNQPILNKPQIQDPISAFSSEEPKTPITQTPQIQPNSNLKSHSENANTAEFSENTSKRHRDGINFREEKTKDLVMEANRGMRAIGDGYKVKIECLTTRRGKPEIQLITPLKSQETSFRVVGGQELQNQFTPISALPKIELQKDGIQSEMNTLPTPDKDRVTDVIRALRLLEENVKGFFNFIGCEDYPSLLPLQFEEESQSQFEVEFGTV